MIYHNLTMRLSYLACSFALTTLCQVVYCNAACGCGTQSCTNLQVGYHTYIPIWCTEYSSLSESECYDLFLQSSTAWIANYRPDTYKCRISECDTSYDARMSIYKLKMFRKICGSVCSNYTLDKYTNCWAQPPSPAVQTRHYIASSSTACQQNCIPLNASSCIMRFDSSTYQCDIYQNADVTTPPVCTLTSSIYTSYYVTCYDTPQCGTPDPISNGMVSYSDLTVSSTATYSCTTTGYELSGTTTVTCQADKLWSTPLPSCQLIDCDTPPTVTNGTITPVNPATTYGSSVVYICKAGYILSGTATISCLQTGLWGTPPPSCQIVNCSTPPNITGATVAAMFTTYMSTAIYTCSGLYSMVGNGTVSCLDDGQWGPIIPSCTIANCQVPPGVTNATVSYTGTTQGAYATYTCFTNHSRIGSPTITCQADGNWTQPTVICAPTVNQVTTVPQKLYITPCVCSTGSYFVNMTLAEIIEALIADTEINTKETILSQYSLKCRPDGRKSSLITGIVGISVLSIIFGTFFILDLLKLCSYFKKTVSIKMSTR